MTPLMLSIFMILFSFILLGKRYVVGSLRRKIVDEYFIATHCPDFFFYVLQISFTLTVTCMGFN
jgi:hypothetical protein